METVKNFSGWIFKNGYKNFIWSEIVKNCVTLRIPLPQIRLSTGYHILDHEQRLSLIYF